ncbi:IS1 family transposase, partial [Thermoanaerobacter sp. CM-CNRG TB177]
MQNIVPLKCPKCNNTSLFYKYGKTKDGYQKYLCRKCHHQFAPDKPSSKKTPKYPRCPVCGKASFLHHDYEYYSNYRCCDKKCNHSFFVPKPTAIPSTSMSKLVGKTN